MGEANLVTLLYRTAGVCDACIARLDDPANSEIAIEDLLEDACLARLNAWLRRIHGE